MPMFDLVDLRKQWNERFAGREGYIKAWTFVPDSLLASVLCGAITECPVEKSDDEPSFRMAYAWMMDRMDESGIVGRKADISPWWCWLQVGDGYTKPTNMDGGEGFSLLELRLNPEQVLFSDFSMWHTVLNYWLNADDEVGEMFDQSLEALGLNIYQMKPLPEPYHSQVQNSWRDIFRLDFVNGFTSSLERKGIQGVFWSLTPDMIVGVVEPDVYVDEDASVVL